MEIGLSLGSNLGDRLANLRSAVGNLAEQPGIDIIAESSVYETEPDDVPAAYRDHAFLNMVVIADCALAVQDLFQRLQAIEEAMGRQTGPQRHAPRLIDIDLIYAGDLILTHPDLTLPHPRWASRRFVLVPLAEVRPDRILPGQREAVANLLLSLPADIIVLPFEA